MEIAIRVVLLFVSIFFIIKGGDFFVESSSGLAKKLRVPTFVIGATIVSLATTVPELLISIFSSADGTTGLAVGNAVGSCICNIGLVCGIAFVIMPTDIGKIGHLKFYISIIISLFMFVVGFFEQIYVWQAFVLIAFAIGFFIFNLFDAKKTPEQENEIEYQKPIWLTLLYFLIGAMGVGGGAWLLVEEVTFLAEAFGVSEQFIGLTVVAIGTSLPELTTTLMSVRKKQPYLAVGNIIGANILNLTLILGSSRLVAFGEEMIITNQTRFVTLPLMFVFMLILIVPMLIKNKTYRWQGVTFLTIYIIYITYLIINLFLPLF